MRRLSAFLMIAALVAVLVPSAALAAKPVTALTQIEVRSQGGVEWSEEGYPLGTEYCVGSVFAWFDGKAVSVKVDQSPGGYWSTDGWTVTLAAPKNARSQPFQLGTVPIDLGTLAISWTVSLLDRNGNVLDSQTAGPETVAFTGTGNCPASGTTIASW